MQVMRAGLAILAIAGFSIPATAEPSPIKKGDPNEVICEKIETIGSRVAVKKEGVWHACGMG